MVRRMRRTPSETESLLPKAKPARRSAQALYISLPNAERAFYRAKTAWAAPVRIVGEPVVDTGGEEDVDDAVFRLTGVTFKKLVKTSASVTDPKVGVTYYVTRDARWVIRFGGEQQPEIRKRW